MPCHAMDGGKGMFINNSDKVGKNVVRLLVLMLASIIILMSTTSCKSDNDLVGKWYYWYQYKGELGSDYEITAKNGPDSVYDLFIEFTEDKSMYNCFIRLNTKDPLRADYKLKGDKILTTPFSKSEGDEYKEYATYLFKNDTLELAFSDTPVVYVLKKTKR